jgi:hypothetical protein
MLTLIFLVYSLSFAQAETKVDPFWAACSDDAERLCSPKERPGECLERNREKLSEDCRKVKAERKKKAMLKQRAEYAEKQKKKAEAQFEWKGKAKTTEQP